MQAVPMPPFSSTTPRAPAPPLPPGPPPPAFRWDAAHVLGTSSCCKWYFTYFETTNDAGECEIQMAAALARPAAETL